MRYGSLFSGIGGLDLGLERAGMECAWQVEIDDYCRRVLAKHWPDVPKHADIFDVDFTTLPPVDLICGGFPCQPFSVAGRRKGKDDARYLWPEFARAIGEARPRWVLLENVPGLLAMAGEFGQILSDLAALGFDAEWDCIPAAAVGAPHLRYRVLVVAHAQGQPQRPGFCQDQPGEKWGRRSGHGGGDVADTKGERLEGSRPGERRKPIREAAQRGRSGHGGGEVSNPQSNGRGQGRQGGPTGQHPRVRDPEGALAHARRPRLQVGQGIFARGPRPQPTTEAYFWWSTEPDVGRVANGVPNRVDRIRALGNAVVPQVAEWVGLRIMEAEAMAKEQAA